MTDTIFKLESYKGAITASWKVPKTNRQVIGAIKRLVKFYFRCKQAKFLTAEALDAIKRYAARLQELGFAALAGLAKHPELKSVLADIQAEQPPEFMSEVAEEKMRTHEKSICSLCKVPLVYPAYIVWRRGLEVVDKSAPIGIICLKNRIRKLNDLTIALSMAEVTSNDGTAQAEKTDREIPGFVGQN
jgi:hypothetical protein